MMENNIEKVYSLIKEGTIHFISDAGFFGKRAMKYLPLENGLYFGLGVCPTAFPMSVKEVYMSEYTKYSEKGENPYFIKEDYGYHTLFLVSTDESDVYHPEADNKILFGNRILLLKKGLSSSGSDALRGKEILEDVTGKEMVKRALNFFEYNNLLPKQNDDSTKEL